MSEMNTIVKLAARPSGHIKETDFMVEAVAMKSLEEGQVRIATKFISLDPAMRGWMNAGTTYIKGVEIGAPMRAFAVGVVLESRHHNFDTGAYVSGLLGAQSHPVIDGKFLQKLEVRDEPLSYHLGILGMPGMTAYFGLLERGKPVAGETVFVSGAAGIIGSMVGQIAKIKGCTAIGTAGTSAKCQFLIDTCGFDGAINYKEENVKERLKQLSPDGVHVYYDNVGGPILDTALGHLARGGRVVICGAISQYNSSEMYGPKNYMKIVTARGYMTGIIVFDFLDRYGEARKDIRQWIESGELKVKEDIQEGIENFASTLQMLFTGKNFGKLILKV